MHTSLVSRLETKKRLLELLQPRETLPSNISDGVGLPTEKQVRFVLKVKSSTAIFDAYVTPATASIII